MSAKRFTAALLLAALLVIALSSCKEKSVTLTRDDYPITDGSAMTLLLDMKTMQSLCGIEQTEAASATLHSTNEEAYTSLLEGKASLIFTSEKPSTELNAKAREQGLEYELKVIAKDALVFYVNDANPVKSLTLSEIRSIYSGVCTDWRTLGGDSCAITAFQLPSETFLQKYITENIMGATTFAPAPANTDITVSEADGAQDDPLLYSGAGEKEFSQTLLPYTNTEGAICYGSRYFLAGNAKENKISLLSIDGVSPNVSNIASGKYTFSYEIYAVVLSSSRESSAARSVVKWFASDEGAKVIEEAGYVPVS